MGWNASPWHAEPLCVAEATVGCKKTRYWVMLRGHAFGWRILAESQLGFFCPKYHGDRNRLRNVSQ